MFFQDRTPELFIKYTRVSQAHSWEMERDWKSDRDCLTVFLLEQRKLKAAMLSLEIWSQQLQ